MKQKQILAAILVAGAGCVLAGWYFHKRPAVEVSTPPAVASVSQSASVTAPAPEQPAVAVVSEAPASEPVAPAPVVPAKKAQNNAGIVKVAKGKAPILDPDARIALSFVGADPDAEAYWEGAINDPNLPAEERQDLIEDLNEDGLSDPNHPGPEDMPLIMNRLALIEDMAPGAMDKVNADAFAEAHKDLVAMLNGEPVK
jgi:hypothetical protein